MSDSLFLSAAFIIVEIGLIFATSIAAYELWIGDFIWTKNEEKQRATIQSQRGGGIGYEPLYNTSRREKENRSGSSRRSSSPDDVYDRTSNPGRGSTGESTRRLFYKLILIALLCRLICFPVETYSISNAMTANLTSTDKFETKPLRWVLLRASQTLPDMTFASAFGLLIVFCAQVAYAALPLSQQPSDGSIGADDNAETVANGNASPQPARNVDFNKQQRVAYRVQLQILFDSCAGCARKTLASKITFFMWNTMLLISFLAIFFVALAIPTISLEEFEICLWLLLIGVYSLLSLVLIYTGALLMKALRPGMLQRKGVNSLALRLIGMCVLLGCVFLDRLFSFGIVAQRARVPRNNEEENGQFVSLALYRRNAISYVFFEVLPVLFILLIMHRKKKDPAANGQNDVLITNSIMSNIFGISTRPGNAQLDTTLIPPGSSGSSNSKGGGLGSRRFQTYHGSTSRADSFPPKVKHGGNASKMNSQATQSKESSPLLPK
mmetsp:Transcript_18514/g.30309  ORF Transcript_18514/g.30309 Transcript_18514/m.30309 type:complete len:495 (+) Transcript_18514:132-1616(+)